MSVKDKYPTIKPSLLLDFSNSRVLDPRIAFSRASNATYYNQEGRLATAYVNEPRFEHDPVTGEYGFLMEEARTNRIKFSESFTHSHVLVLSSVEGDFQDGETVVASDGGTGTYATGGFILNGSGTFSGTLTGDTSVATATIDSATALWTPTNLTITPNNAIAPDGSVTAALLAATASDATLIQDLGVAVSAAKTGSIFIKRVSGSGDISLTMNGGTTWTTKEISTSWTRISHTQTLANEDFGVRISTSGDSVLVWGGQVENGGAISSYISTLSSSSTRATDTAFMTGEAFSSWYIQGVGTLYAESMNRGGTAVAVASIDNNISGNSGVYLDNRVSSGSIGIVRSGTTAQTAFTNSPFTASFNKVAITYATNSIAAALNGGNLLTDNSAVIPTNVGVFRLCSAISSNGSQLLKKVCYYPERISNDHLVELTK